MNRKKISQFKTHSLALALSSFVLFPSLVSGEPSFQERSEELGLTLANGPAAWADYDRDGWVDLLAGGVLWHNDGGKRFSKAASPGQGVFGDFDNDGYPDIFSWSGRQFLRNIAGKEFQALEGPEFPHSNFVAASWADHDGDGLIDLYACGYETWPNVSYPDVRLRNVGESDPKNRRFVISWQQSGGDLENFRGRARGATSCDFDRDGDVDIYISNYRQRPNHLWRNDGKGQFSDAAKTLGIAGDPSHKNGHGHTIGSAWGDLDNDGFFDLFVGNFNHHDNRISEDSKFYKNLGPKGQYHFQDRSDKAGLAWQESYASPALADYDNDGDLDLFLTTVYAVGSFNIRNYPVLYRNDGNWHFTDVTEQEGLDKLPPTYQAAWADFDRDGDLDLVTAGKLFVNRGSSNRWLRIHLDGNDSPFNRHAIGAQVSIHTGGRVFIRQVEAGTGQGNQNESTLHFGLGHQSEPVQLEIFWPNGKTEVVKKVPLNQRLVMAYKTPAAGAGNRPGIHCLREERT